MSEPKGLAKRFEVRLERAVLQSTVVEIEAPTAEEASAIAEGLAESVADWDTGEALGHAHAADAVESEA